MDKLQDYSKQLPKIKKNIETKKSDIWRKNGNCNSDDTKLERINYINFKDGHTLMINEQNGFIIGLINNELLTMQICFEAVEFNGEALLLIPEHLWTDEMVFNACKQDLKVLGSLHKEYITPKLILSLIRHGASPGIYCYIEPYMLLDYESISSDRRARRGSDTQYLYREDCINRLIPALKSVMLGSNISNVQCYNIMFMFI